FDLPIIGDSNAVPQDDPEFTLNLYAEKVSDQVYTLKPAPGSVTISQFSISGGGRGQIVCNGRQFGVRGGYFQEMIDGAPVIRGALASNTGKIGMIASSPTNGLFQILIVGLAESEGYVFELATDTFTALTAADNFYGGGSQVAYCA